MFCLKHIYCGDYYGVLSGSGIYKIHFVGSLNFYVGSAACLSERWSLHRHQLAKGNHGNVMLKKAWAKYGAENIRFTILELVEDKIQLVPREQFWMDTLKPAYNIAKVAGSQLGLKHGEESLRKISAGSKGRPKSPETIARWRDSMIRSGGFIKSPEVGRKISAAKMGKPRPDLVGRPPYKMTDEIRAKISASKKGKPYGCTRILQQQPVKD